MTPEYLTQVSNITVAVGSLIIVIIGAILAWHVFQLWRSQRLVRMQKRAAKAAAQFRMVAGAVNRTEAAPAQRQQAAS